LSIIGVDPAVAFNRIWPREDILTAVLDELTEFQCDSSHPGQSIEQPARPSLATGSPMNDQSKRPPLAHASGTPVTDNINIQTAGPRGPALLQDVWLIEKLAHFSR
jgi:hypothetical protein